MTATSTVTIMVANRRCDAQFQAHRRRPHPDPARVDAGPGPDLGVHRWERQHESRSHSPATRPAPRGRDRRFPRGDRRRMAAQGPRRANHASRCAPGGRAAGRDDRPAPERAQPALPGGSEHPGHPYCGSMARSSGAWTNSSPRRPSRASWARSKNGNGPDPFFAFSCNKNCYEIRLSRRRRR